METSSRFVILFHAAPSGHASGDRQELGLPAALIRSTIVSHWDLMLQAEQQLYTWAVECQPFTIARSSARMLPAHRLDYLDYEGPISQNRGTVTRCLAGTYRTGEAATAANPPKSHQLAEQIVRGQFSVKLMPSFIATNFATIISGTSAQQIDFEHQTGRQWILKFNGCRVKANKDEC